MNFDTKRTSLDQVADIEGNIDCYGDDTLNGREHNACSEETANMEM